MLLMYSFLIDVSKIFEHKKYIIYVGKYNDEIAKNSIKELFENFKKKFFSKNDHTTKELIRKDEQRDLNTRILLKQMVS